MGSIAPTAHAKTLNAASLLMMHLHGIAEQRFLSLETLCAWSGFVSARIDARFFDAPSEAFRGPYPPLEGDETSEARSWVDAHEMSGGAG